MSMLRHQVVWEKCAVVRPGTDEEVILKRGELLPDWTAEFTKHVLVGCGAVKAVEQLDPALTATTPEPVYLPEHQLPPLVSATAGQQAPTPAAPAKPVTPPAEPVTPQQRPAEDKTEPAKKTTTPAASKKPGNGS